MEPLLDPGLIAPSRQAEAQKIVNHLIPRPIDERAAHVFRGLASPRNQEGRD